MAKVERSNENGSDKPVAIETSYLRGWLWLKKRGLRETRVPHLSGGRHPVGEWIFIKNDDKTL